MKTIVLIAFLLSLFWTAIASIFTQLLHGNILITVIIMLPTAFLVSLLALCIAVAGATDEYI